MWWGIVHVDNVQLAMLAGREVDAVASYEGVLGIVHPLRVAVSGGC